MRNLIPVGTTSEFIPMIAFIYITVIYINGISTLILLWQFEDWLNRLNIWFISQKYSSAVKIHIFRAI
jgi:hypothetical protein